ncbi:MAG: hypothetical protein O7D33_08235, partial [Chloroflexi bacterium]|nr:hypothetical protein [Chloroflexota bacterium]
MTHRWHLVATLSLALLVSLMSTQAILADEGTFGDIRRLAPDELAGPSKYVRNLLSGRSWLITNGLDPALGIGLESRRDIVPSSPLTVQPQAGGGGAALVPFRDPSAKFSRNIL